jgi:CheY-like chemotaxis protein
MHERAALGPAASSTPVPQVAGWRGLLGPRFQAWTGRLRLSLEAEWVEAPVAVPGRVPGDAAAVHVLVVDDNPANLQLIAAMLQSQGLLPLLAADGAEAVALAAELPFDLILMDLQMPILDGIEATCAIRLGELHSQRPPVPVIAYSTCAPGMAFLAAHGLNGSLAKPCEQPALQACLLRWCPGFQPPAWRQPSC